MNKTVNPGEVVDIADMTELMEQVKAAGSDTMLFRMERKPEAGRTFSAEGVESFLNGIKAFVVGRIAGAWEDAVADGDIDKVIGPHEITAQVTLNINGRTLTVPDDMIPWWSVDGTPRADGQRKIN